MYIVAYSISTNGVDGAMHSTFDVLPTGLTVNIALTHTGNLLVPFGSFDLINVLSMYICTVQEVIKQLTDSVSSCLCYIVSI